MLVCLSSGHRSRYLRDIARSLALPHGSWLDFRYERRWITSQLLERVDSGKGRRKLAGTEALIAYIDQSNEAKPLELVPCRYARLVRIASVGQTVSLQLEVQEVAYAEALGQVNEYVAEELGELLPHRTDDGFAGAYWFEVDALSGVERSNSEAVWESVVAQLAPRSDFANERFFYSVRGIVDVGKNKPRRQRANMVQLRPSRDYELLLYHYYPNDDDDIQAQLQASVAGAPIEFTATPELLLDSRYDLKRIGLRTGAPVPAERGVLTLRRRRDQADNWEWDLDLGVRVRAAWFRQALFGVVVAIFLAIPPIVAANQNSSLSSHAQRVITIVTIVSSLFAGLAAAFGLRRSI